MHGGALELEDEEVMCSVQQVEQSGVESNDKYTSFNTMVL